MELYILSKQDLSILSICKLADYQINLDEETNAKSTFTLMKTNGLKKGNYMTLNGLYRQFIFVIDDVQTEKGSNVVTVTALDISNIFDRKVIEKNIDTMKSKSIEEFLANTISENFVNSDDTVLNVNYIEIYWHTNTQGNVATNAENGLYNFHTFLINCRQYKNIYTDFKLENLGNPQTVEGKRINVEAKNRKIVDIMLEGESQQATRSGKNLFDSSQIVNVSDYIVANGTGIKIIKTTNGRISPLYNISLKANTEYTISCNLTSTTTYPTMYCQWRTNDGSTLWLPNLPNGSTTFKPSKDIVGVIFYLQNTDTDGTYVELTNLQIEKGSTATDYELYGASPSPDYRSKIENLEGRNILQNKQKTQTINGVTFTVNKDKSVSIKGTATADAPFYFYTSSNYLMLKKGTYTLSGVNWGSSTSYKMLIYKTDWTFIGQDIGNGVTFTLEEDANVFIYIGVKNGITVNTTVYPQLEGGTVATPYVPYNSLEIKDVGKNLYTKKDISGTRIVEVYINELTVGTYTLSAVATSSDTDRTQCLVYDATNNKILGYLDRNVRSSFTFTLKKPTKKLNFYASINYDLGENDTFKFADIQIEQGTTATLYKPYQEQKVDFPLSEGQKLMEGSYLADDGIHHVRKQYTFTGNEVIALSNRQYENCACFYINNQNLINKQNNYITKEMCSHFTYDSLAYKENRDVECITDNIGIPYQLIIFQILKTRLTSIDVTGFKAYLAEQYANGTPLIVEYELAEEEIVPYTEEQQEAWDNIKNLTLFEGVNHISSDANMVLKYYPLEPVGLKFILRIDIENKQETTELIDTTLPEVADYNKIYEEDVTAKVTAYIRENNTEYNLYLKTDRTTTTNKNDPDRASGKIEVISVDTADKAEEEALNVMKGNNYKHLVEFKITKTSKLMDITKLHIRKTYKNQNRRRYI